MVSLCRFGLVLLLPWQARASEGWGTGWAVGGTAGGSLATLHVGGAAKGWSTKAWGCRRKSVREPVWALGNGLVTVERTFIITS